MRLNTTRDRPVDEPKGVILLVDDEPAVLRAHERLLVRAGFLVHTATDGQESLKRLAEHKFDAVVSDISMPNADGIELLRGVREQDLDLPVILATGQPAIETAILAVHYGALQYLLKPVEPLALIRIVERAVTLCKWARARRESMVELGQDALELVDRAGLHASFRKALATMWMAYQPIVSMSGKRVVAHEALLRSNEASLPSPLAVIRAAERLELLDELGRTIRAKVAARLDSAPPTTEIFVNLHTRDLMDESLYNPHAPLSKHARRVTLEVTERASLDGVSGLRERVQRLRALGYHIAIDDLGAGYAGLTSFAQLEPDVVKIDMSLIRGIHNEPVKQKLVRSVVSLGRDLALRVIAEGVETTEERDALIEIGCELHQGYLYSRPTEGLTTPRL